MTAQITLTPPTNVAVRDLFDEMVSSAALPAKHNRWVKTVTGMDLNSKDGYAFQGTFIDKGTIQVKLGKPRLFLVGADTGGSYPIKHYRFVVLEADGSITPTDIQDNAGKRGWALRVRDRVLALLAQHAAAPPPAPAQTTTPAAPTTSITPVAQDGPTPNDAVRSILVGLVRRHGLSILGDPRRLVALLHDACGDQYALEQRLLVTGLQAGIVTELCVPANGTPPVLLEARLVARLVDGWGIYRHLAEWVITAWQEAL